MSDSPIQVDGVPRPLPVEGAVLAARNLASPGAVLLARARAVLTRLGEHHVVPLAAPPATTPDST